jgi:selenocysteine lyase/cysteine desulfurase
MPLLAKSEFVGLEQVAHLCTGGEAPWLRSHDQASACMGALKSAGMAGREQLFAVYERAPASHEERAGNVCFLAPDAHDLAARLARLGVLVWGGEGRVRVSTHIYNDREDVHRLLDVLDSLRREARAGT